MRLRSICIYCSLWCLQIFTCYTACAAELIDRVVAVVNDDVVTLSELERDGKNLFQKISQEAPASSLAQTRDKAREEVLNALIDKLLVEQRAVELHLSVTDEETEKNLARILEKNNVTMDRFIRSLETDGMTLEEYKTTLKWQILQSKVIGQEIRSKIVIPDERIREQYNAKYAKKTEGYHLQQIGFRWDPLNPATTKVDARRKAEQVRENVLAGENFNEVAKMHSELPSAKSGGDIGVFTEEELTPLLRQMLHSISPGDVGPVVEVESDGSYQFFKLISAGKGESMQTVPFESVKDEIAASIQDQEIRKHFERWVTTIRQQAYIKKML